MRGNLDFSSWNGLLSTLLGLILVSVIAVGIRLIFMQTIQRRRERENRQINERLKTLIAAYKTLGGSFTGELAVDPAHLRDRRRAHVDAQLPAAAVEEVPPGSPIATPDDRDDAGSGSERRRRIRDAVEAALSDVILLGTEEQVALAANAANEMVAGRPVHTAQLVVSLRTFIRQALDLDPIAGDVQVPQQGPLRIVTGSGSGSGSGKRGVDSGGAGGGRGSGGGMGAGMGIGMGMGAGVHAGGASAGAGPAEAGGAVPADVDSPRG